MPTDDTTPRPSKAEAIAEALHRRMVMQGMSYGDAIRETKAEFEHCHSDSDGDCEWSPCPQLRDREPKTSGRHCPLDRLERYGE